MLNKIKNLILFSLLLLLFPLFSSAQFNHTDILSCVPNGSTPENSIPCPDQSFDRSYLCLQSETVGGYCPGINWTVPTKTLVASCTPGTYGEYVCASGYTLTLGACDGTKDGWKEIIP